MKDTIQINYANPNPNPNLEAFNRKVQDLGIDLDECPSKLNLDQMNRAYIEGIEPSREKLIRDEYGL